MSKKLIAGLLAALITLAAFGTANAGNEVGNGLVPDAGAETGNG